jgi:hypothetical protein
MMDRTEQRPLVRCPCCDSPLLYPTGRRRRDLDTVLDRRCPECDHRDRVVTTSRAAEIWCLREQRIRDGFAALADAFDDGPPWGFDDIHAFLTPERSTDEHL